MSSPSIIIIMVLLNCWHLTCVIYKINYLHNFVDSVL
jgi:hypothetical protein